MSPVPAPASRRHPIPAHRPARVQDNIKENTGDLSRSTCKSAPARRSASRRVRAACGRARVLTYERAGPSPGRGILDLGGSNGLYNDDNNVCKPWKTPNVLR